GGNRKGKLRTYVNLMTVMLLGGLWHGAAWSYAVWGGFHGLALSAEKFLSEHIKIKPRRIINLMKAMLVFSFVTLAWLLFKLPDFEHVIGYFRALKHNIRYDDDTSLITYLLVYSSPVIVYHFVYLQKSKLHLHSKRIEYIPYAIMLFLILVNSGSSGTFI